MYFLERLLAAIKVEPEPKNESATISFSEELCLIKTSRSSTGFSVG
ncbi:Uncharacterised protein [Vibrio cholerae]|nr:Uncharacterised protein [Vibrio cholerae]